MHSFHVDAKRLKIINWLHWKLDSDINCYYASCYYVDYGEYKEGHVPWCRDVYSGNWGLCCSTAALHRPPHQSMTLSWHQQAPVPVPAARGTDDEQCLMIDAENTAITTTTHVHVHCISHTQWLHGHLYLVVLTATFNQTNLMLHRIPQKLCLFSYIMSRKWHCFGLLYLRL